MKKILIFIACISLAVSLKAQDRDFSKMPAQIIKAKENGDVKLANALTEDYFVNYIFKLKKTEQMSKDNLTFIVQNIHCTECKAFDFLIQNKIKVNEILGENQAEYAIKSAIAEHFIPKEIEWNKVSPNWTFIEKQVAAKFGSIGQESVYGKRMMYYFATKDWNNFGKFYQLYFEKALQRPEYIVNNLSWSLFLHVKDPTVLKFACDVVMKYALDEWYALDYQAYDTYANLLYKIGRPIEAMEWEKKAIQGTKNTPSEKEFTITLEKMQKGEVTWEN